MGPLRSPGLPCDLGSSARSWPRARRWLRGDRAAMRRGRSTPRCGSSPSDTAPCVSTLTRRPASPRSRLGRRSRGGAASGWRDHHAGRGCSAWPGRSDTPSGSRTAARARRTPRAPRARRRGSPVPLRGRTAPDGAAVGPAVAPGSGRRAPALPDDPEGASG